MAGSSVLACSGERACTSQWGTFPTPLEGISTKTFTPLIKIALSLNLYFKPCPTFKWICRHTRQVHMYLIQRKSWLVETKWLFLLSWVIVWFQGFIPETCGSNSQRLFRISFMMMDILRVHNQIIGWYENILQLVDASFLGCLARLTNQLAGMSMQKEIFDQRSYKYYRFFFC